VAVNPTSGVVYVANVADGTVSIVDDSTDSVLATVAVNGGPRGVAVDPNGQVAYVARTSGGVSIIGSAPQAPTGASANAGNAQATLSFTSPVRDGGSPVTSYTVTATDTTNPAQGGQTASGTGSPITVTGLTNGDTYTLTVTATNTAGTGSASSPSNPVTPVGAPGAPTAVSATAGNGTATASFTSPVSNGGSAITSYTVTATDTINPAHGGQTASGSGSPITVSGLTDGDAYTLSVTATNGLGTGPASGPSNPVTPVGAPGAPTAVSATAGNSQATVSFTPPTSNGGSALTSYTVTATDTTNPAHGGQTASGSGSPITVSGLTNGDTYTLSATATNGVGTGSASGPSNPVTPVAPIGPAKTLTATGGNGQSVAAGATFPNPLSATATDANGKNVPGVAVTFTVTSGSATFPGGAKSYATTTNSGGVATAAALAANASGAVKVSATASGATPATYALNVTPASADLVVSESGPASAADGSKVTETVTVHNNGPSPATNVVTDLVVPCGLSVTAAPGATNVLGTLAWTDKTLASGAQVTYTVTLTVAKSVHANVVFAAGTLSLSVADPHLANNGALAPVRLG
jgi:YVTN family beta-propeller protein